MAETISMNSEDPNLSQFKPEDRSQVSGALCSDCKSGVSTLNQSPSLMDEFRKILENAKQKLTVDSQ